MGTVTYPNPKVIAYLNESFVPVQINVADHPESMGNFNAQWTPTIMVRDIAGKEYRRTVGYLGPEALLAELELGLAQMQLAREDYAGAVQRLEKLVGDSRGLPIAPETMYWLGVAQYRSSHDPAQLKRQWARLKHEFPDSEWTGRSDILWA